MELAAQVPGHSCVKSKQEEVGEGSEGEGQELAVGGGVPTENVQGVTQQVTHPTRKQHWGEGRVCLSRINFLKIVWNLDQFEKGEKL